jgi:hypothetical protein
MASFLRKTINFKDGSTDYVLNDQTSMRSGWTVSPYYYIRVIGADGLYGADISSESHPIPHNIGERSGDSFRKGKGIALSGTIEGRNLSDYDVARAFLQQCFWNLAARKLIYTEIDGTLCYYTCRVLNDLSVVETYDRPQPIWTWTVGLRCDDPRQRKVSDDSLFYSWMV